MRKIGLYTFSLLLTFGLIELAASQDQQVKAQSIDNNQKKEQVQNSQLAIRNSIDLPYGSNTEILTFAISHMSDFVIKTTQDQQIKASLHVYWKQNNVYIGSEYREGENLRLLVYEDNYRILFDYKFYVTYGIKFQAEKGKVYTIRFLDEGRIAKLVTMQMTKTITAVQDKANKQHIQIYSRRMSGLADQLKVLSSISEFTIVMHEKGARSMNHSICIYMTYLLIEATIILIIVILQLRVFTKMLKNDSIV